MRLVFKDNSCFKRSHGYYLTLKHWGINKIMSSVTLIFITNKVIFYWIVVVRNKRRCHWTFYIERMIFFIWIAETYLIGIITIIISNAFFMLRSTFLCWNQVKTLFLSVCNKLTWLCKCYLRCFTWCETVTLI